MGSSTFCSTFNLGNKLKNWKTNPIFWFRMAANCFFEASWMAKPSSLIVPELGVSRQPRMCINVERDIVQRADLFAAEVINLADVAEFDESHDALDNQRSVVRNQPDAEP